MKIALRMSFYFIPDYYQPILYADAALMPPAGTGRQLSVYLILSAGSGYL